MPHQEVIPFYLFTEVLNAKESNISVNCASSTLLVVKKWGNLVWRE